MDKGINNNNELRKLIKPPYLQYQWLSVIYIQRVFALN